MHLKFAEAKVDWSSDEKDELRRLHSAFPPPRYDVECSLTEDGDPWCVVHDNLRDIVKVHVARIGRRYAVVNVEKRINKVVAQMKTAIDLAVS